MSSVLGRALFVWDEGKTLGDYLHGLILVARERAASLKREQFGLPNSDPVKSVAAPSRVEPLTIDVAGGKHDVQDSRFQVPSSIGGSRTVDGLRVTKSFPYAGPAALWGMQPSQRMSDGPHGYVDEKKKVLILGMDVTLEQADQAKAYIEEEFKLIQQYIAFQKMQIDDHNRALESATAAAVDERRAYFAKADEVKKRLLG